MARNRETIGREEMQVLRYVADFQPVSVREVADHIAATSGKARTTVLTVMERLREKGYLVRRKKGGVYRYSPKRSQADVLRSLVADFVREALGGSVSPFVAYLAEEADLDDEQVRELGRLVADLETRRGEVAMGPTIEMLNDLAACWSGSMLRATWQGGLAIAAAWVLVRCWPGSAAAGSLLGLAAGRPEADRRPCLGDSAVVAPVAPAPLSRNRFRGCSHRLPNVAEPGRRIGADQVPGGGRPRRWPHRLSPASVVLLLWLSGVIGAVILAKGWLTAVICGGPARRSVSRPAGRRHRSGPRARPAERARGEGRSGRGPADACRRVPAGDPAARRDVWDPSIDGPRSGRSWLTSWPTSAVETSCGAAWRGW